MGFAMPEEAALRDVPGKVRSALATSVSPDGKKAVVLWEDGKQRYLLLTHLSLEESGWVDYGGGSGGGITWTSALHQDETDPDVGVLSVSGEAPPDAVAVVISWRGEEHTVRVRDERFLFVAWDVPYSLRDEAAFVSYVDARGVRRPV